LRGRKENSLNKEERDSMEPIIGDRAA